MNFEEILTILNQALCRIRAKRDEYEAEQVIWMDTLRCWLKCTELPVRSRGGYLFIAAEHVKNWAAKNKISFNVLWASLKDAGVVYHCTDSYSGKVLYRERLRMQGERVYAYGFDEKWLAECDDEEAS